MKKVQMLCDILIKKKMYFIPKKRHYQKDIGKKNQQKGTHINYKLEHLPDTEADWKLTLLVRLGYNDNISYNKMLEKPSRKILFESALNDFFQKVFVGCA